MGLPGPSGPQGYGRNASSAAATGEVGLSWSTSLLINKTYGGTEEDYGHSAQPVSDGGYIIVGDTASYGAGNRDAWLIKTDSLGNLEWNKTFGGSELDDGYSVQQTSDWGYIIAGATMTLGGGLSDAWLIKTDSSGNEEWNRTFGGSERDYGMSVQQTSDNGYVIAGTAESYGAGNKDVWLIKTDSLGNEEWNRTFGGSEWELGLVVQQTSDDGYVVTAGTRSYGEGNSDAWLIKTDSLGNEEWNKTFGGTEGDYGMSVQQTSDDGFIMTGRTYYSEASAWDLWLIKTDSLGNGEWNRTFGGAGRDEGQTAQQTSDSGYIIAGATSSYGAGEMDMWLIKTDNSGNEEWNKTFGGSRWDVSSMHWFGHAVHEISDDEYTVVGSTKSYGAGDSDIWLIKFDASGSVDSIPLPIDTGSGQDTYSIGPPNCIARISAEPATSPPSSLRKFP
ncbi:MAG: hypothetical protein KAW39_00880 [Thermoplasmata archaeon]|nr:hypothetical protein [Thermoplasmata archaeon]